MVIKTYWQQLLDLAGSEAELKSAFVRAGISTSVFYRTRRGDDLSYRVASRVGEVLMKAAA